MDMTAHIVPAGGGDPVQLPFGRPRIKVGAGDGSGQIGLLESELPPGGGFGMPHWHEDLDETFYVLEGEIEYLLDAEWRSATAGTTVFVPARTVHAFRNRSDAPARQLVIGSVEAIELVRALGATEPERWGDVFAHYRSHAAGPPAPGAPDGG
jgi:uncharacterized cupin superfamily protein